MAGLAVLTSNEAARVPGASYPPSLIVFILTKQTRSATSGFFDRAPFSLQKSTVAFGGGGLRAAVTSRPQAGKEQAPPLLLPAPILQQTLRAPSQAVLQGLNFTKERL